MPPAIWYLLGELARLPRPSRLQQLHPRPELHPRPAGFHPQSADVDPGPADFDPRPIELECLRGYLPDAVLEDAARRAARVGVGADRVLIAAGTIDEDDYLRRACRAHGLRFEPLDDRAACPLQDDALLTQAAHGILPLNNGDGALVVAPQHTVMRRLLALIHRNPACARLIGLTSMERFTRFILRHAGAALAEHAAENLRRRWPQRSAAPQRAKRPGLLPIAGAAALAALLAAPEITIATIQLALAILFFSWLGLRLLATMTGRPAALAPERAPDSEVPLYTVIVALYREARVADALLRAMARLDYPREKLDLIVAVEAGDIETQAALDRCRAHLPMRVVTLPDGMPRTKPRALNAALAFARGRFTVVFDAEDRPEPDQLRRALAAFAAGGDGLACVQARLCIDNTDDGWLARHFTAEYAGHFDVMLNGMIALRLPIPLGGSSNHFRTDALRAAGGWDAYNVTEDADLGMRLARLGYRCGLIDSTTLEEAPAAAMAWLRQRTRWFKGWLQTWLVHMREPVTLWRDLGAKGFLTLQLIVGGNVLAALVHPLFLAGCGLLIWQSVDDSAPMESRAALVAALYGGAALAGYATSALLGWLGLRQRDLIGIAPVLLTIPLHWLLLSCAAWRAVYQFIVARYVWEKTEHGLARHSRAGQRTASALLQLERMLTTLKEAGELPAINEVRRAAPAPRYAARAA